MARGKKTGTEEPQKMMRPALTPESRENQMIAMAIDLAEKQLREGTASAQVITHFLKLGTTRERLEKEILEQQRELIGAKTQAIQETKSMKELYANALKAMRLYSGQEDGDDSDLC